MTKTGTTHTMLATTSTTPPTTIIMTSRVLITNRGTKKWIEKEEVRFTVGLELRIRKATKWPVTTKLTDPKATGGSSTSCSWDCTLRRYHRPCLSWRPLRIDIYAFNWDSCIPSFHYLVLTMNSDNTQFRTTERIAAYVNWAQTRRTTLNIYSKTFQMWTNPGAFGERTMMVLTKLFNICC